MHTTNYFNTFIQVADDCPVNAGVIPIQKGDKKSIAELQFELIAQNPYQFNSDDVLFQVFAERQQLTPNEFMSARTDFFSKGQACLRASPLTKRYGWGIHCNADGKIALFAFNSPEYLQMSSDSQLRQVKAMKSKR